jgi:hypothetical protein
MWVIVVPNQPFPPGDKALHAADKVVDSLAELTEAVVTAWPADAIEFFAPAFSAVGRRQGPG